LLFATPGIGGVAFWAHVGGFCAGMLLGFMAWLSPARGTH
jgi:membrane associated rhomboid family serine protease